MAVNRREYNKNGKPTWGYAFSYRHRRYRKAGFATKREAEHAEQVMRTMVIVEGKSPTPARRIRFSEMLPLFFENRRAEVASTTFEKEEKRYGLLLSQFGRRMVDEVETGDILGFRAQRVSNGLSNRSANLELSLIRQVFKFAVAKGFTTVDPTIEVHNLPETFKDHPLIPAEQLENFLAEAAKNRNGVQLVIWIKLQALTGLRPRESLYLEWSDIDFDRSQVLVRPKTDSPLKGRGRFRFRPIEIHPVLRSVLLNWRKQWEDVMARLGTPHQWVFFHPSHPEQRAKSFNNSFDSARTKAGIPRFRPYDLRHLFISQAIMSGVDLFTVTKWSGHASTKMVDQVYGHLRPEFRAQQMAKIQFDFLKSAQPMLADQAETCDEPATTVNKPIVKAIVKAAPQPV